MNIRKIIQKRLRYQSDGVNVAGDVNAVIAANVGERGAATSTSASSHQRIVQHSGSTAVSETTSEEGGSTNDASRDA